MQLRQLRLPLAFGSYTGIPNPSFSVMLRMTANDANITGVKIATVQVRDCTHVGARKRSGAGGVTVPSTHATCNIDCRVDLPCPPQVTRESYSAHKAVRYLVCAGNYTVRS